MEHSARVIKEVYKSPVLHVKILCIFMKVDPVTEVRIRTLKCIPIS